MISAHLKNMLIRLDHLPRDWGENIEYLFEKDTLPKTS